MRLPAEFINRMKDEMASSGISEDGFFESFDNEPKKGIRINKSKVPSGCYGKIMDVLCPEESNDKIPWCDCGFYTESESSGNSPYYHAGVIYPQEPSAMLPGQTLGAKPGDVVIDLCAAPGGKACRIAEELQGEGVLIANEISSNRAKALLRNIERMGIPNAVVLNEDPINMRQYLAGSADKIIVDAPCSGEGMFRRDPAAVKSWERYGPDQCAALQDVILESADIMLKAGGELVYSTCTFGVKEDEDRILHFLELHPGYEVVPHPEIEGVTHAPELSKLPGSMRIWPHRSEGDGHFCVHLRKAADGSCENNDLPSYTVKKRGKNMKEAEALLAFMKEIFTEEAFSRFRTRIEDGLLIRGEHAMLPAADDKAFGSLTVVKNGLYLGEFKSKGRDLVFSPSNSLALTLRLQDLKDSAVISYSYDSPEVTRYLKGETLSAGPGAKRNVVIAVDGFCLGFGKRSSDGMIKNLYPKAWRLM